MTNNSELNKGENSRKQREPVSIVTLTIHTRRTFPLHFFVSLAALAARVRSTRVWCHAYTRLVPAAIQYTMNMMNTALQCTMSTINTSL